VAGAGVLDYGGLHFCSQGDIVTTVLVTGGAGYIGSHAVWSLLDAGFDVVVVDDFSTGRRELVPAKAALVELNVADPRVAEVIKQYRPAVALHFAGSIIVEESVSDPLKYYLNNTAASRSFFETCVRNGLDKVVFSSTAAVYGLSEQLPVSETSPTVPINPYGASKLMVEWMLRDAAHAHGLRYVAFRYFNVAGADQDGRSGPMGQNVTHLIRVACQHALGLRPKISVFGEDYATPDGTCIRDFIHVNDLADAHVSAVHHLVGGGQSVTLNCGYGHGYSVRQVLDILNRICEGALKIEGAPRRPGDPPALVADVSAIGKTLDWTPRRNDLDLILRSALGWERRLLQR
jgi:UDP-glucose 4-epimerase